MDYSKLIQFATVRQIEYIEAIERHGSQRKAADAMGINARSLERSMERLKVAAAAKGWSPEHGLTHPIPPGQMLRGVSTLYDPDGRLKAQWVLTKTDKAAHEAIMREAIAAMCEDIPKMGPTAPAMGTLGHLCNVYTLTDSHVGALAWDVETKSGDWDLSIAEKTLVGCFAAMVEASPKAGTCVIAQLGDFLHYDSAIAATTPMHGNILDADGRMPKMVRVAIRILRTVIAMALAKHERVVVLLAEGNHDLSSSVWLRAMFQAMYENEPRIEVIDSELPYYCYSHGETMLAWHHGHLKKTHELPILFAAQFPKVWGGTTKRYCHTGHRHHVEEKEHSGMTVIQHPTLAARDAYAARGGWIAERQVTSITYSDKFGQVARNTVTPEMLA
jgi:hypothetical protein